MAARTEMMEKGFLVRTRNLVHVPAGRTPKRGRPLVVALHGQGMNAEEFSKILGPLRARTSILFVPEGVYPFDDLARRTAGFGDLEELIRTMAGDTEAEPPIHAVFRPD